MGIATTPELLAIAKFVNLSIASKISKEILLQEPGDDMEVHGLIERITRTYSSKMEHCFNSSYFIDNIGVQVKIDSLTISNTAPFNDFKAI